MNIPVRCDMAQQDVLNLKRAILLYEGHTTALATVHEVAGAPDSGAPILLPGRCLTRETLDAMVLSMGGIQRKREILAPKIVCFEAGKLAWWRPSERRPIFFRTSDKAFNTELNGNEVLHPPLLFLADPGRLSVFALAESVRPVASTVLFVAPYFNLYAGGMMCAGNTRLPDTVSPSDIAVWERAFFETNFTHANAQKVTAFKGGHDALWHALLTATQFDPDWLLPMGSTLQEVINA